MDQEIIVDAIKHNTAQQSRIADALEEILRLVKLDQKKTEERYRKYDNEDDMLDDLSKPWKETK